MGFLAERRVRKLAAQLEAMRAEREAYLATCERLCQWEVRFDLQRGLVTVFGSHAHRLSGAEREWLDTYVAVGYVVKQVWNFSDGGDDLWLDVMSGEALDPGEVEQHLTFTNAAANSRDDVEEPTHAYFAQVYRHQDEGFVPFMQTPYAPGEAEEVLARWSLAALLTVLRSAQDEERQPIERALDRLEHYWIEGDWEPGALSQVDLIVMADLAEEGLVSGGLLADCAQAADATEKAR